MTRKRRERTAFDAAVARAVSFIHREKSADFSFLQ
jgi:hypothetical protein